MRVIIGYGNELRGEDAFGIDVVKELEKYELKDTKLISTFQLTPEIVLDLQECDEIVFVDACYSMENQYKLACSIEQQNCLTLSHHIGSRNIIGILNSVYNRYPIYEVYSMLTDSFDEISDNTKYISSIQKTSKYLINPNNIRCN